MLSYGDTESATALAAELGGLPLALTQAAGFGRANAISSLADYLRLYRERGAELRAEGTPADYPHTVATTWQVAMDRLTERARDLLNLVACYAPDAIPVPLLFGSWDELDRHRAVGELRSGLAPILLPSPRVVALVAMHEAFRMRSRRCHPWGSRTAVWC